jgi:hypothetical protein
MEALSPGYRALPPSKVQLGPLLGDRSFGGFVNTLESNLLSKSGKLVLSGLESFAILGYLEPPLLRLLFEVGEIVVEVVELVRLASDSWKAAAKGASMS